MEPPNVLSSTPIPDEQAAEADARDVQLRINTAYSAHGPAGAVLESLLPSEKDLEELQRPVEPRAAGRRVTMVSAKDGLERVIGVEQVEQAVRGRSGRDPRWLDFEAPSPEDMQRVEQAFGLHPVTTEDCMQGDTTDKVEYFDKYLFVTFTTLELAAPPAAGRMLEPLPRAASTLARWGSSLLAGGLLRRSTDQRPTGASPVPSSSATGSGVTPDPSGSPGGADDDDEEDAPANFALVLFPDLILTFHYAPVACVSSAVRRLRRARGPGARAGLPPADWVAYALLDAVVDQLVSHVEDVAAEVSALDELVVTLGESDESELLKRIGMARRRCARLRRQLLRKREALHSLAQHAPEIAHLLSGGTLVYVRDVSDHVVSALQKLAACRETLAAMQANYHAKLSVDIARSSARMNRILKLSSLVGTLFLWHTFVTGLFAMNINIPLQTKGDESDTTGPFFGIVAEIALSTLLGLALFRYMGWM